MIWRDNCLHTYFFFVLQLQLVKTNTIVPGTSWFASGSDSAFFKADTLRLIKYVTTERHEDEAAFLAGEDYVTFSFRKNKILKIQTHQIQSWTVTEKKGIHEWLFDAQQRILNLYFNNQLRCRFMQLSTKQVNVKSKYAFERPIKTIEVTFKRMTTTAKPGLVKYWFTSYLSSLYH